MCEILPFEYNEEDLINLACKADTTVQGLERNGLTIKQINKVMKLHEKIAFYYPKNDYEELIRRIYHFVENIHPDLGYDVYYLTEEELNEKFPDTEEYHKFYIYELDIIDEFKKTDYKSLDKSKLLLYYLCIQDLSFFNSSYHIADEIELDDLELIHKILNTYK